MRVGADAADAFHEEEVLDVAPALGQLLDAAVVVAEAQVGVDDDFAVDFEAERGRFLQGGCWGPTGIVNVLISSALHLPGCTSSPCAAGTRPRASRRAAPADGDRRSRRNGRREYREPPARTARAGEQADDGRDGPVVARGRNADRDDVAVLGIVVQRLHVRAGVAAGDGGDVRDAELVVQEPGDLRQIQGLDRQENPPRAVTVTASILPCRFCSSDDLISSAVIPLISSPSPGAWQCR